MAVVTEAAPMTKKEKNAYIKSQTLKTETFEQIAARMEKQDQPAHGTIEVLKKLFIK